MCVCVCPSVREHISETTRGTFIKVSVHLNPSCSWRDICPYSYYIIIILINYYYYYIQPGKGDASDSLRSSTGPGAKSAVCGCIVFAWIELFNKYYSN